MASAGAAAAAAAVATTAQPSTNSVDAKFHVAGDITGIDINTGNRVDLKATASGFSVLADAPVYVHVDHKNGSVEIRDVVEETAKRSGCVVINGNGGMSISGDYFSFTGGSFWVNGKQITAADIQGQKEKPADPRLSNAWVVDTNGKKIGRVTTSHGNVTLAGAMFGKRCTINLRGVGSVEADGNALDVLNINVSGSGSAVIKAKEIANAVAIISGTGNIKLSSRIAELTATVSGVGSVGGFHALTHVEATVSGVGSIFGTRAAACTINQEKGYLGTIDIRQA